MKFFLKKLFGFLLLLLISIFGLVLFFRENQSIQNQVKRDYLNGYLQTLNGIKSYQGRKLIFVGGSNVGFGLNSERIESVLGIKSYNFGVAGGIGIQKPIEDIKNFLNQDDIIVISPEYSNFNINNFGSEKYIIQYLQDDSFSITNSDLIEYISSISEYYSNTLKSITLFKFKKNSGYNIDWFNDNGDVIGHNYLESKTINFQRQILPKDDEILELDNFLSTNLHSDYYLIPPVTDEFKFDDTEEKWLDDFLTNTFKEKFPLKISSMTFKKECFFDTSYHLTYECKEIRTDIILDFLKTIINENLTSIKEPLP